MKCNVFVGSFHVRTNLLERRNVIVEEITFTESDQYSSVSEVCNMNVWVSLEKEKYMYSFRYE